MAILNMKPHILWTSTVTEGEEDENGHYQPSTEVWTKYMKCDVVPASLEKNAINYGDGRTEYYSYTVYLPTCCRDFEYGEKVKLTRFCEESPVYQVKGFQRYQHQCKLLIGKDGN